MQNMLIVAGGSKIQILRYLVKNVVVSVSGVRQLAVPTRCICCRDLEVIIHSLLLP